MKKQFFSIQALSVLIMCWVLAVGVTSCKSDYSDPDDPNEKTEKSEPQTDDQKDDPTDNTGQDTSDPTDNTDTDTDSDDSQTQLTGDGTRSNPFTVEDVIALNNTKKEKCWVKGVIVGQVKAGKTTLKEAEFQAPFKGDETSGVGTNLLIAIRAGETETSKIIPIELPKDSDVRNGINLPKNEGHLSKTILFYGTLENYFRQPGVKSVKYAEIDGKTYGTEPK